MKILNRKLPVKLAHCIFFIFVCACLNTAYAVSKDKDNQGNKDNKDNKKVTLLLDWKPNTNHTGFFVAKNKGFFQEVGLDVTIVNPTPTSATMLVGSGRSDFGVSYATNLIYSREAGVPVVGIASIVQSDASCFVWRKSSGITNVKDFEGKRYGGSGSPEEIATLKFLMEKNNADFSKLKILTVGISDFIQTTEKNADITWEYKGWGILSAEMRGVEIGSYCPSEHLLEFQRPSLLIITSDQFFKKNPAVVKAFLKASQKGFEFAVAHPVEAAQILVFEVPGLDEKFIQKSQAILSPQYQKNALHWGDITPAQFEPYANWMLAQGLVKKKPDLNLAIMTLYTETK